MYGFLYKYKPNSSSLPFGKSLSASLTPPANAREERERKKEEERKRQSNIWISV